ncbi:uncharacterized protein LOC115168077 [Salmo trutta]|uniref:uncharacterized protein LOC115168077 n=1 Tax=Salmo trutta TaxID=8032 RepID=UPI0011320B38|nr:uncharacterized protein LOC115168077 [Salmo trutta]
MGIMFECNVARLAQLRFALLRERVSFRCRHPPSTVPLLPRGNQPKPLQISAYFTSSTVHSSTASTREPTKTPSDFCLLHFKHRPQFHCFHEGTNQNPFRFLLTSLQGTDRPRKTERKRVIDRDHSMKRMKSAVVVIVILNMLHRCLSNNLRTEILKDLSNLTPENFTYPKRYRVPTLQMQEKACECQGMFATELKHVVNKVKARTEEHKPLLNRLQKNIQALPQISTPEEASICPMKNKLLLTRPPKTIVLIAYRRFLQNLNEKECK